MRDPRDEPTSFNPVEYADEQRRAREDREYWEDQKERVCLWCRGAGKVHERGCPANLAWDIGGACQCNMWPCWACQVQGGKTIRIVRPRRLNVPEAR